MPLDKRDAIIEDKIRIIKLAEKCINDQVILINERDEKIEELKTRIDELKDEASDRSTSFMETDDND